MEMTKVLSALGFFDSGFRPADRALLARVEAKLDLILDHLGLAAKDFSNPAMLSPEAKLLAQEPRKKFEAVKLHRAQTGADLNSAKHAVESYLTSREQDASPS